MIKDCPRAAFDVERSILMGRDEERGLFALRNCSLFIK